MRGDVGCTPERGTFRSRRRTFKRRRASEKVDVGLERISPPRVIKSSKENPSRHGTL